MQTLPGKRLHGLAVLAAILLPALLLFPVNRFFGVDWENAVWMAGYFGEHFRQYGSMPEVLNTPECPGLAFPVFYGFMLYPLLGLLSAAVGPQLAVRLAVLLLFAGQFFAVRQALRRLGAAATFAMTGACLVIWATYALTNLYNRAALAEFFAVGFLTCAVCGWFGVLAATDHAALWRRGLRVGLWFTLAAGSHPITALLSLPVVGVLLVPLAVRPEGPGHLARVGCLATVGVLAVVVLSPWCHALGLFRSRLAISTSAAAHEPRLMTDSIDHWTTRLFPLPLDPRCLQVESTERWRVSTPYLDAQINVPLLVLCAAVVWRRLASLKGRRRLALAVFLAVPVAYTAVALVLSLWGRPYHWLPAVFTMVQYGYRWVSFVNLGLLVVLLFALYQGRGFCTEAAGLRQRRIVLCAVLILAGAGVVVKLKHAHYPRNNSPQAEACRYRAYLSHLPHDFYGYGDYTTPGRLPALARPEEVPGVQLCDGQSDFGRTTAQTIVLREPGHVRTDMTVFPWNRFWVDGRPVPPAELRSWTSPRLLPWSVERIAVPVPAGRHVIEHRFEPGRTWRGLRRMSSVVLLAWALVCCGAAWRSLCRFGRRKDSP
jgi:hypothetical protein